jgi:hypothetical protein
MPSFHVRVPHALSIPHVQSRLAQLLANLQAGEVPDLDTLESRWSDNELHLRWQTRGLVLQGTLVIHAAHVEVTGTLPLAAALFRGRIERTIREELSRVLADDPPQDGTARFVARLPP